MNRKVVIALLVLSLSFLLIQGEETSSPEVDVDRQENGAESAMGLDPGQAARNEVDQMILKADKIRGIEKDGNVEFKGIISHRELKNAIQLYRKALDLAQSTEYNTSVSYIYNSLGEIAYYLEDESSIPTANYSEALALFRDAELFGNPDSQHNIAVSYALGIGVEMNEAKSILYDHFASLGGSLRASMSLGYRHLYGLSVPISCETALKYYSTVSSAVIDLAMQKQLQAVESISLLDENLRNNNPDEEQDIVQYYRDVADAGDPNAQLFLGHLNYFGTRGVQRNFDVARHYYNQAAQSGDVAALAQLGQMYLDGIGVPQNNETALKLLTKAVKEGSVAAHHSLGYMYFNGIGVEKDLKTAFSYFKIAADKSNPEAQFAVGTMYYLGQGTEKSLSTAFHYFSLASDQGHLQATYNLGQFYEYGIGTVPSCLNAVKMKKLVAERGPWMQDLKTAHRSFLHGHYERSTLLYARLGIEGVQLAQKNAAYLLDEGYGYFESETHNLAFKLWKSSSRQGDSDAHRIVGDYYYYGVNGSPPDYGKAVEQYRLAGDLRNARALFDLGFMYHSGLGIGRDLHLAKRYYDLAMEVDVQAYAPCTVAVSILQIELFFRGLFSPFSGSKIDVDKSGSQSAPLNDQDETSIWGDLKEQFNLFWKDIFDAAGIDQEDFLLEDFILLGAIAGLIAIVMARHHQVRLEAQFPNLPENRRGQPRAPPVGPGLNNQLPPQDVDNEEKEDVVEPENEDR